MNYLSYILNNQPQRDITSTGLRTIDGFDWRSYYSGADVSAFLNDYPIYEFCGFSYKLQEQVKLHYGYNSYVRMGSSRGSRIVQGNFMLNLRDPLYLHSVLKKIEKGEKYTGKVNSVLSDKTNYSNIRNQIFTDPLSNQSVEELVQSCILGKITYQEALSRLKKISSTSDTINKEAFRRINEVFRNKVWGNNTVTNTEEINRPFYSSIHKGLTLKLILGEPGLNNVLLEGELDLDKSRRQIGGSIIIRGLEIVSEALEISETGEPLRTVYEFIGADVDKSVED